MRRPGEKRLTRPRFARQRTGPWREHLRLSDGRELVVRPIDPLDTEPLRAAFALLSPDEVRLRFMHPLKELTREHAVSLTHLDPARAFALVVAEPLPPGQALIGGVARVGLDDDGRHAEFGLIIGRLLQGHGLGTHLLGRLVDWCRRRGLQTIYGDVLIENGGMLEVTDALGFERHHVPGEPGVLRVTRRLRPA